MPPMFRLSHTAEAIYTALSEHVSLYSVLTCDYRLHTVLIISDNMKYLPPLSRSASLSMTLSLRLTMCVKPYRTAAGAVTRVYDEECA